MTVRELVTKVSQRLLSEIGEDTIKWLKTQGIGFTIFTFTFEPGAVAYISTANREDMLRSIKEWIAAQEAGLTTDPPGEKPVA